ncbi:hypothetical protein SLE2022_236220 [Rubroshorea leprosula]
MARHEIRVTVAEDKIEKVKPSEEADVGPLTSNKSLDEMQITDTEDDIKKLKLLDEAATGALTSNKPLDEMQSTLSEDEIRKLKSLDEADKGALTSNKPLIQEVTSILRWCYSKGERRRYFKPISVAIGPLNHQKKTKREWRFERGEKWKLRLAAMFIHSSKGTVQDFYKNVKEEISKLRNCYNFKEGQNWTDEKWALMFLVDGCALLLFIILDVSDQWEEFRVTTGLAGVEKVDFFLLENQLPYQLLEILRDSYAEFSSVPNLKQLFKKLITKFINRSFLSLTAQEEEQQEQQQRPNLKKLFKKLITKFINRSFLSLTAQEEEQQQQEGEQQQRPNLKTLFKKLINSSLLSLSAQEEEQQQEGEQQQQQEEKPVHLLDLLRRRLMGVKSKKKGENQINEAGWLGTLLKVDKSKKWLSIRNVKELKEKGIRFKAREKVDAITKIDFNNRCCMPILTLAPISLHNTTMPLLLNLMAYELCPDFEEDCEITSHLSFLDSLIDDREDVKELRDAGVLHHGLGSDEAVAELFNKISRILVPNLKMDSELRRIHEYCSKKSHPRNLCASFVAKLTDTKFSSPWNFWVFLGALAALIMTGIQTYNSFQERSSPNEL